MIIHPIDPNIHNLKVVVFDLDKSEKDSLLEECFLAKQRQQYKNGLVGNIEEQYNLPLSALNKITQIFNPLLIRYHERHLRSHMKTINNLYLADAWVNFQKKYEFNPCHNHSGLISFVIWMQIPYSLSDEFNYANCKSNEMAYSKKNSIFEFVFTGLNGEIGQSPFCVDKSWEGMGVMFPAKLHHTVYPFLTSDGYRISISGNFMVK